ncbi:hypothetical protein IFM89_032006 [Coptis chinensis]|uniref:Uncharacterized protein n=1 Tax=Coptis chinensis TaxID=261450 RepID=A0A835LCC3_9MAGN|nr:hypothetical protein IFM89_032006 [Coptis chinensis]
MATTIAAATPKGCAQLTNEFFKENTHLLHLLIVFLPNLKLELRLAKMLLKSLQICKHRRETGKSIQIELFGVFKRFVANPDMRSSDIVLKLFGFSKKKAAPKKVSKPTIDQPLWFSGA